MEQYALRTLLGSAGLILLAFVWLVCAAFAVRRAWGFGVLFFPPTALVFVPRHWNRAAAPVALFLVALVPLLWSVYTLRHISLGPYSRIVDGKLHLTLTGWDRSDYSLLKERPNVAVLQMANPDVTDQTLSYLDGMEQLYELDLNDTRITDEGLAVLARLPRLSILRLRNTAITDEGFQKHLAGKESLMQVDVTGTKVASKTLRAWKAAAKEGERRYLK
jgi:hypothetical protein